MIDILLIFIFFLIIFARKEEIEGGSKLINENGDKKLTNKEKEKKEKKGVEKEQEKEGKKELSQKNPTKAKPIRESEIALSWSENNTASTTASASHATVDGEEKHNRISPLSLFKTPSKFERRKQGSLNENIVVNEIQCNTSSNNTELQESDFFNNNNFVKVDNSINSKSVGNFEKNASLRPNFIDTAGEKNCVERRSLEIDERNDFTLGESGITLVDTENNEASGESDITVLEKGRSAEERDITIDLHHSSVADNLERNEKLYDSNEEAGEMSLGRGLAEDHMTQSNPNVDPRAKKQDKLKMQTSSLGDQLKAMKKRSRKLFLHILQDEEHVEHLKNEIKKIIYRLEKINKRIELRQKAKKEYGKTILETESAYGKIMEHSRQMMELLAMQAAYDDDMDDEENPNAEGDEQIGEYIDSEDKEKDQ